MRQTLTGMLAAGLLLTSIGCGTIQNQSPRGSYLNTSGEHRPYRVYGGVRTSMEQLLSPVEGETALDMTSRVGYAAVDIPCSLVADTIALPFDARQQWLRLYHPKHYDEGFQFHSPASGVMQDSNVVQVEAREKPPAGRPEHVKR